MWLLNLLLIFTFNLQYYLLLEYSSFQNLLLNYEYLVYFLLNKPFDKDMVYHLNQLFELVLME